MPPFISQRFLLNFFPDSKFCQGLVGFLYLSWPSSSDLRHGRENMAIAKLNCTLTKKRK